MKNSKDEIEKIKKLYGVKQLSSDDVIDVLEHAYQLECALEVTFLEKEAWLKEIANQEYPNPGCWDHYYHLWLFRDELSHYCESMSLEDAIDKTIEEWIK